MAEFKEVMQQYHRMCDYYFNENMHRCYDCPLGKNENLSCVPGDDNNIDKIEEWESTVINWSKTHRGVTVRDLLSYIAERINPNACFSTDALLEYKIPADIVEKFNLQSVIKGDN